MLSYGIREIISELPELHPETQVLAIKKENSWCVGVLPPYEADLFINVMVVVQCIFNPQIQSCLPVLKQKSLEILSHIYSLPLPYHSLLESFAHAKDAAPMVVD